MSVVQWWKEIKNKWSWNCISRFPFILITAHRRGSSPLIYTMGDSTQNSREKVIMNRWSCGLLAGISKRKYLLSDEWTGLVTRIILLWQITIMRFKYQLIWMKAFFGLLLRVDWTIFEPRAANVIRQHYKRNWKVHWPRLW